MERNDQLQVLSIVGMHVDGYTLDILIDRQRNVDRQIDKYEYRQKERYGQIDRYINININIDGQRYRQKDSLHKCVQKDGQKERHIVRRLDRRTHRQKASLHKCVWMDIQLEGQIDGHIDRRTHSQKAGQIERQIDIQIEGQSPQMCVDGLINLNKSRQIELNIYRYINRWMQKKPR